MPPAFSFTPKEFASPGTPAQAEPGPLIIFYCEYGEESGQKYAELAIHQRLLFANSKPRIPQLLDEIDEPERHKLEDLVLIQGENDAPAAWEALGCFRSWLYTGVYQNLQISGNHIHAYLLAERLGCDSFANAVMKTILQEIPARKYDEDLRHCYRHIWSHIKADSLLRKLFFDCAIFWKLELGGGWKGAPRDTYGEGLLGLDLELDHRLISALQHHKEKFCGCYSTNVGQNEPGSQNLLGASSLRGICRCQKAPWVFHPNGYFIQDL